MSHPDFNLGPRRILDHHLFPVAVSLLGIAASAVVIWLVVTRML